ncbi:hypothetical protein D3C74_452760 [compost metagenome]
MLPLDYQAFNRFHHGGKVRTQNVKSLENSISEGELQGREMKALRALYSLIDSPETSSFGNSNNVVNSSRKCNT